MQKTTTKLLTAEDLWSEERKFRAKTISGLRSTQSGTNYTTIDDKKRIVKYSYETGESVETLFDVAWAKRRGIKEIEEYEISPDGSRLLIAASIKRIYRHSFMARYYVWDVKTKTLIRLSQRQRQRLPTFSPDSKKVAFISSNNLFIKDLETGKETQVTTDGRFNSIINGAADWVYEEEFALKCAFEWSPDGNQLAYIRFDESKVKQFIMLRYNSGYPEKVSYKYPRAGEKNSEVSVFVYDLPTGTSRRMDVGDGTDQYIPRIIWTKTPGVLAVKRLNRLQNQLDVLICNTSDGSSKVVYTDKNDRYIESDDSLTFLEDKQRFVIVSERSGWRHLYLCDMKTGKVSSITSGEWDVSDFCGYNEEACRLYYTAARPTPPQRTLFSIRLDGNDEMKLSTEEGCSHADFSKGCRYYINTFSRSSRPPVVSLFDADGRLVRVLEDNSALLQTLKEYYVPKKEFFSFKTSDGVKLNGWMLKPKDFDDKKIYPVMMTVYGGPNSQTVMDSWGFGWDEFMVQSGFIVASVDGRGSGGRGEDFRKCTYGQLGGPETTDQIEGAKYLGSLPYVDASRIGVFGWSYGGFMSASCILRGPDVFKAAVAVATVSNFRFYDTIYTERYMGLPQDNPKGYDDNAPISHAANLKGNLLLVHGVMDDNVHYQNSLELADALVKAGKQFEVHFLPNRAHGISGGNTHVHLHPLMLSFFIRNL